jgi:DNA-binding CsgD family transcriptional regulator
VLGPIYRLLGRGLNNDDIATGLNITQEKVEGCIAWLLHFLAMKNRQDLVLYASKGK